MKIELKEIGKKFHKEWIFKGINLTIQPAERVAILGANGSGKSTLLQIISGILSPNQGSIHFSKNEVFIEIDKVYEHISIAAPYLELPEEMTLLELIQFHFSFKRKFGFDNELELIQILDLEKAKNKQIRYYSSGMKQRVKLALALFSDVSCILLDEPTSNLDEQGVQWYLNLTEKIVGKRTILVSSNQSFEYGFCNKEIRIADYKS